MWDCTIQYGSTINSLHSHTARLSGATRTTRMNPDMPISYILLSKLLFGAA